MIVGLIMFALPHKSINFLGSAAQILNTKKAI